MMKQAKRIGRCIGSNLLLAACVFGLCYVGGLLRPSQPTVYAQTPNVSVPGQPLPGSLGAPINIQGIDLSANSVNVQWIILSNTDTSSHTVTVSDCSSPTAFTVINAYTIAASSMWPIPLGGTRFSGCFQWSADSALVMGSMVGTRGN